MKSYAYGYASSGWRDRLISFDGQAITYDAIGNPTTYRGHTLTWTNVRRLASYGSHTFSYGADGIRYKKDSTTYTFSGSTILKETNGTRTLTYFYGVSGVVGFQYNGTNYYYQKNLQGDVIAIYDANGTKQAEYVYDAWGKVLSVTNCTTANIGTLNPFRYRSYYYDTETGLYYLQTRYYDPETGRFINSDSLSYLGDGAELSNYNLFAYCGNNPVMGYDPEGTLSLLSKIAIGVGAALCIAAIAVLTCGVGTATLVGAVAVGAAKGALIGAAAGTAIGAGIGYAATGDIEGALEGAAIGFGAGAVIGAIIGGAVGGSSFSAQTVSVDPKLKEALNILDQSGIKPGQTSINQSKVLDIYNSYNPLKAQSSYTNINGSFYVSDGHHTTIANVMKYGKLNTGVNMGMPVNDPDVVTKVLWSMLKILP